MVKDDTTLQQESAKHEPLLPPLPPLWPKLILPLVLMSLLLGGMVYGYWKYKYEPALQAQLELSASLATAEPYEGELVTDKFKDGDCYRVSFQFSKTKDNLCVDSELFHAQKVGAPFDLTLLRDRITPKP